MYIPSDPLSNTTVVQGQDQDILGSRLAQSIHRLGLFLPFHHGADGQPSFARLQLGHSRASPSGGDRRGLVKLALVDVVVDEDVSLGSEDTSESRFEEGDQVGEFRSEAVVGFARGDEHGFRGHQGGNGVETSSSHGIARF